MVAAGGVLDVAKGRRRSFNFRHKLSSINPQYRFCLLLFLFFSFWSLLVRWLGRPRVFSGEINVAHRRSIGREVDRVATRYRKVNDPELVGCRGRNMSVYIYDLPSKFNADFLRDCAHLNRYGNMCHHVVNHGLGQPLSDDGVTTSAKDPIWFATNQFTGEEIFHIRMVNHPCRTTDPTRANLFYVPFYGGFHMSSMTREANHTARDELAVQLAEHVRQQPWWARRNGKDHFMVLGRTAWDFMRPDDKHHVDDDQWFDYGSNTLLRLPTIRNMLVFTIERHPWEGRNQLGIPYPSYFHPYTVDQVRAWQRKVAGSDRAFLFSYIGARRKEGAAAAAIRDELMRQCSDSEHCRLLDCTSTNASACNNPKEVMKVMMESHFCLQPRGDSFTRRSMFDSMLAGCIPVVFSRHTTYTQYQAFLPKNATTYSVFIDEDEVLGRGSRNVTIEDELMKIGSGRAREMRNVVVGLIPRLTFAHPNASSGKGFEDVVDVALSSLLGLLT